VTRIRLDVVVVGDLRRPGVPDAPRRTDLGARVLVPQRNVVDSAAFDRGLERGEPDQRRLVFVGLEDVNATVPGDDSSDTVRLQPVEHLGHQVAGRLLRTPWRGDDLQTWPH